MATVAVRYWVELIRYSALVSDLSTVSVEYQEVWKSPEDAKAVTRHDLLSVLTTVVVVTLLPEFETEIPELRNWFDAMSAPRYAETWVTTGRTEALKEPVQDVGSLLPAVRLSTAT